VARARSGSDAPPRELAPAAVVVTGFSAATPAGTFAGQAVERVLDAPAAAPGVSAADPLATLDPERSRRFDRGAALLTSLAERALVDARLEANGVGIVSGTAFGSVERSVRFVLRAAERGVRRANPAEFPHLVASAASGNASIYAGLTGPALGVSAGAAGAEAALSVAAAAVRMRHARAFVAGAAEGFDPIVAEVLGPLPTPSGSVPRTEGGGALVLELEAAARARGVPSAARWLGTWWVGPGEPCPARAPERERALVVSATASPEAPALLRRGGWGDCPERSVLGPAGFHEAVSAIALVAAAAAVVTGDADEALALSGSARGLWVTHFERAELAS